MRMRFDLNVPFGRSGIIGSYENAVVHLVAVQPPQFSMSVNVIYMIWNARQHYTPEALAQRAANRKLFFDKKYPERPFIITPGDKQWLQ